MSSITILTIMIPVVLAFIAYFNSMRLERRKNRLERINKQLNDFYGPLLATVKANNYAWKNFKKKYLEGQDEKRGFVAKYNPNENETREYYNWMKNVFMPNNELLYRIVVKKTSLLEDNDIPLPLLKLAIHILEARAEFNKSTPNQPININYEYPSKGLIAYCEKEFRKLKEQQSKLMKNSWYSIFKKMFSGVRSKNRRKMKMEFITPDEL